jgi:uncharacterized protein (DUF2126 family)
VDQDLVAGDVRLTMGGEPTFVATRDRDAAEWNTDALGPTKRNYATELLHRLRQEYGAGGFVHLGQGKWYPGEQLPRWALSLYWRADGGPSGTTRRCLPTSATRPITPPTTRSASSRRWRASSGCPPSTSPPATKTPGTTCGANASCRSTWTRSTPNSSDELERVRLRRVFSQGLESTVGYVLPLQANAVPDGSQKGVRNGMRVSDTRWSTGPWFFRDERMYLIPGDSPMGYRLPLDSLPWVSATDYPYHIEQDPSAQRDALPDGATFKRQYAPHQIGGGFAEGGVVSMQSSEFGVHGDETPLWQGDPAGLGVPGAAPAQPMSPRYPAARRIGRLADPHRPVRGSARPAARQRPQGRNQHRRQNQPPLHLHAAAAAPGGLPGPAGRHRSHGRKAGREVVLEGYPPPRDPRLKMLQVTPDPGVIEVNIHPAHNWGELVEHTEFLYEAAHQTHLCAEKFMTDGRHTGTGGGNHFVMGGATPADSPFLRKPELLGSLIAYWHNHPS